MRKNIKKVASAGLVGLLSAGLLVGNVEYASHAFSLGNGIVTVAAKEINKNTKEKVKSNKAEGLDKDETTKQETVYVNTDTSGKATNTIVSDWLKNSGVNGTLNDVSSLKNIENVKGNETFKQDGEKVTWNTAKQDIYYQGKTDKEVPVGANITYKLDGKEVKAEDILGKSGKLEITIKYFNNAKKTVDLNGTSTDLYVPFMLVSGTILPVDNFKNITIDNGSIVSEGDNDIVVAYGMPGLKESLDLDSLDFGDDVDIDSSKITKKLTDTVTIKADVTKFEMNSIYTVATNSLFDELDFDKIDDLDDLSDKVDELTDSADKLIDGTETLQDGTQKLKNKFSKYNDGIETLGNKSGKLKSGATKIKNGVTKYANATDQIVGAANTYVGSTKKFATGVKTYTAGTAELVSAINTLQSKTKDLPAGYKTFGDGVDTFVSSVNTLLSEDNMTALSAGVSGLKSGVEKVDAGLKSADAGVDKINAAANKLKATSETEQVETAVKAAIQDYTQKAQAATEAGNTAAAAQYAALAKGLTGAETYIQGGYQVAAGIDAATNGKVDGAADDNGAADLKLGIETIEKATDVTSTDATSNLYAGIKKLDSSAGAMSDAAKKLRAASPTLTAGNKTVKDNLDTLSTNIDKMNTASNTLVGNNKTLDDAATQLISNATKFKKKSKELTSNSDDLRKSVKTMGSGVNTLYNGVKKIVTASGKLSNGIADLNKGANKIKNGMAKFNEKGIEKITSAVTDLIDTSSDLNDRISKISSISEDYTSFSGKADNMDGSVKYVIATDEVKADD